MVRHKRVGGAAALWESRRQFVQRGLRNARGSEHCKRLRRVDDDLISERYQGQRPSSPAAGFHCPVQIGSMTTPQRPWRLGPRSRPAALFAALGVSTEPFPCGLIIGEGGTEGGATP